MNNFPFEERRKYPRYDVAYPAIVDLKTKKLEGMVINISELGLGVKFPQKLDLYDEIDIKIECIAGDKYIREIEVKAIVIWVEKEGQGGVFRAGLSIIDSSEEDLGLLRELIQELRKE